MAIKDWAITREPKDQLAETRISIGSLPREKGAYIVFRGDPDKVIDVLEQTLAKVKEELPKGSYTDTRGRPQG